MDVKLFWSDDYILLFILVLNNKLICCAYNLEEAEKSKFCQ